MLKATATAFLALLLLNLAPASAAEPAPEAPLETIGAASRLVGRPWPGDADVPVLQSVFRPWTLAENRVRGVTIKTRHENFDGQYEHILLQDGKVVAVRLFILDIADIKQITPELEHLYIQDFAAELLNDFRPSPKLQEPVPDVFAVETPDMDKWTPRQWSYPAQNKLTYTICWAPAAYVQVWIETPQFHAARLAEEARQDAEHPVSY
jgi:hypothetical protein